MFHTLFRYRQEIYMKKKIRKHFIFYKHTLHVLCCDVEWHRTKKKNEHSTTAMNVLKRWVSFPKDEIHLNTSTHTHICIHHCKWLSRLVCYLCTIHIYLCLCFFCRLIILSLSVIYLDYDVSNKPIELLYFYKIGYLSILVGKCRRTLYAVFFVLLYNFSFEEWPLQPLL